MFNDKLTLINRIENLAVIGVSDWVTDLARQSPVFSNAKIINRIYNWIDVDVFKQKDVYALVLRLISTKIPEPEKLGVPQSVIDLYKLKRGLVLVTGPTGSGKSTTLAAIIDKINKNRDAHIITLEDPIEYMHTHNKSIVNQREVGQDTLSYANALRAALREDPDVILVGEMRD